MLRNVGFEVAEGDRRAGGPLGLRASRRSATSSPASPGRPRGAFSSAAAAAEAVDDWQRRAFLPQRLAVADELTVTENIALPLLVRGREPAVDGLLDALDLQPVARRPATQTSLGEQQRTALARALALGPALLVLDEPTGHQDDDHVERVLAVLVAARDRGTAVLVATHDERVLAVADRVLTLVGGRLTA